MGDGGEVAKKTITPNTAGMIFDLFMQGFFMGLGLLALTCDLVWIR